MKNEGKEKDNNEKRCPMDKCKENFLILEVDLVRWYIFGWDVKL